MNVIWNVIFLIYGSELFRGIIEDVIRKIEEENKLLKYG